MSKSVILEGFLSQKVKNKDPIEVYTVLSATCLKTYRSQITYKQSPDSPIRTLDFSDKYNVLPMPFEKNYVFSLFKRGEKAEERLYLESSTKSDYDLWLGHIETRISRTCDTERLSTERLSTERLSTERLSTERLSTVKDSISNVDTVPQLSPVRETVDVVDKPLSAKAAVTRYNIKSNTSATELKQLQQACEKLEADLKKEQSNVCDITLEKEELKKKLSELEKKTKALERERSAAILSQEKVNAEVFSLNSKMASRIEFNDQQLDRFGKQLAGCIDPAQQDLTSYQFLVNHLSSGETHSSFLNTLLKHQLERLMHHSEIDPEHRGSSLLQYLTRSIDMSRDSVAKFITNFLVSLSTQISPSSSSKGDLSADLHSMVRLIVNLNPPPDRTATKTSFQHTALEIAYMLGQRSVGQTPLSNGHSEPMHINQLFNELLQSEGIESVNKVFIVELSRQISEKCRAPQGILEPAGNDVVEKVHERGPVNELFESVWEDLVMKLEESDSSNKDLMVAIEQLSARNQELESASRRAGNWRNIDQIVNYYAAISHKMCGPCQSSLCDQLQSPVASLVEQLVLDFTAYWRCLNDLTTFLANKKTSNGDLRAALEMARTSTQRFETLMSNLQEITQRDICNPGSSKPRPIVNEL